MSQEIEIRFRLNKPDIEKNSVLGKLFLGVQISRETNIVFSSSRGLAPLRIRRSMSGSGNSCTIELTQKGEDEIPQSAVRSRNEHTFRIHPGSSRQFDELRSFLAILGYVETFLYEKNIREIHYITRRRRVLKIFWAVLPILGDFLEIEGESPRVVLAVARSLGFNPKDSSKKSYYELSGGAKLAFALGEERERA